uniref:protein-serine/threonine phosphatase n=1 Tax=Chromera velia CCMP2878 TaxID=1169474 RepID=A0A0G4FKA7_9ALVE|eukprot:Cvel_17472.t1-p1 / transcript=Cvel_17472.t1 / gene=Cvel_17472 / organism=Chromera_velia_CCMP2878 / gene_product=RNA polymerase II subunit A C-terminal domain, putative / transcript_product=RNA polymerase II subunit A C-terminal domain, putative / location=Cvel_scaffold1396:39433-45203(-) / protein_length=838 / sequence_SO=supercontig / SO=protein_coding / is_pseudo=false
MYAPCRTSRTPWRRDPSPEADPSETAARDFFSVQKCTKLQRVSRHSLDTSCAIGAGRIEEALDGFCTSCKKYDCVSMKEHSFHMKVETPLWQSRKPALILDIDNTIVQAHAGGKPVRDDRPDARLDDCRVDSTDFLDEFGLPELYRFKLQSVPDHIYYLKLRPGLRAFLQKVSACYELCIYTAAAREYTNVLLAAVDPEGTLFGDRIWTKDKNAGGDARANKEIQNLFSKERRPAEEVLVIDDRKDHWMSGGTSCSDRVFQISFYAFFSKQIYILRKNYPPDQPLSSSRVGPSSLSSSARAKSKASSSSSSSSSVFLPQFESLDPRETVADTDRELVFLGDLLVELFHRYTSSHRGRGARENSLLDILNEMQAETLAGYSLILSGWRKLEKGKEKGAVAAAKGKEKGAVAAAKGKEKGAVAAAKGKEKGALAAAKGKGKGALAAAKGKEKIPSASALAGSSSSRETRTLSLAESNYSYYPAAVDFIRMRAASQSSGNQTRGMRIKIPLPSAEKAPRSADNGSSFLPLHPQERVEELGGQPVTETDPREMASLLVARPKVRAFDEKEVTSKVKQALRWQAKGRQIAVPDHSWITLTESLWRPPPPQLFPSPHPILKAVRVAHRETSADDYLSPGSSRGERPPRVLADVAGKQLLSAFDFLNPPPELNLPSKLKIPVPPSMPPPPFMPPRAAQWDLLRAAIFSFPPSTGRQQQQQQQGDDPMGTGSGNAMLSSPTQMLPLHQQASRDYLLAGGPLALARKRQASTLGWEEKEKEGNPGAWKRARMKCRDEAKKRIVVCEDGAGARFEGAHMSFFVMEPEDRVRRSQTINLRKKGPKGKKR